MPYYDSNDGEFLDFETLDDWRERDIKKDSEIERLTAEVLELRDQLETVTTEKLDLQSRIAGAACGLEAMRVEGVNAFNDLSDMRNRLQAMHRRAQKAESARDAEKALADYLAEGVRDLYEHSQYLGRYNKERGL